MHTYATIIYGLPFQIELDEDEELDEDLTQVLIRNSSPPDYDDGKYCIGLKSTRKDFHEKDGFCEGFTLPPEPTKQEKAKLTEFALEHDLDPAHEWLIAGRSTMS